MRMQLACESYKIISATKTYQVQFQMCWVMEGLFLVRYSSKGIIHVLNFFVNAT